MTAAVGLFLLFSIFPTENGGCSILSRGCSIYSCFTNYTKDCDCVDHSKLWEILKDMEIPDHLICLLRNQYEGQEAAVRTGHGTTDWFLIRKGAPQGYILSP